MDNFLNTKLISATLIVAGMFLAPAGMSAQPAGNPPAAQPAPRKLNWLTVGEAMKAKDDSKVLVRAQIVSVAPPRPNSKQPYSIYISDAAGSIRVVIFQDTWELMSDTRFIEPGAKIDVAGKVSTYRGERQLEIARPNHIRQTPGTSAGDSMMLGNKRASNEFTLVNIGGINVGLVGQPVKVRGSVRAIEPSEQDRIPDRIFLQDKTGEIEVIYWSETSKGIAEANKPAVGAPLQVTGIVGQYRGKMQIRVDESSYVSRQFTANTSKVEPTSSMAQRAEKPTNVAR